MLNLTANEKRALLITCLIIIVAAIIQYVLPQYNYHQNLDYSQSDSIFYRLSSLKQSAIKHQPVKASKAHAAPKKKPGLKSIDLNNANKKDLERLPRIGPKTAQRILQYRNSIHKFSSNDELMNVKGIGPKTYNKIKPYLKDM